MISIKDIYKVVITIIKKKYPAIPIVSQEVVEGHDKPYFYVQILPLNISNTSVNYNESKYGIVITYFQKKPDSIVDMDTYDNFKSVFGYGFKVNNVYCVVSEYDMDYIGQDDNIVQISFNISYVEYNDLSYDEPIADEVAINNELK